MRISDWSSDVCSSDLRPDRRKAEARRGIPLRHRPSRLSRPRADGDAAAPTPVRMSGGKRGGFPDPPRRLARDAPRSQGAGDRKSGGAGKRVAGRVYSGGRRSTKKKKQKYRLKK